MDPVLWGIVITAFGALIGALYSAHAAKTALIQVEKEDNLAKEVSEERTAQLETLRFLRAEVVAMRLEISELRAENALLRSELAKATAILAKLERQHPTLFLGGTNESHPA